MAAHSHRLVIMPNRSDSKHTVRTDLQATERPSSRQARRPPQTPPQQPPKSSHLPRGPHLGPRLFGSNVQPGLRPERVPGGFASGFYAPPTVSTIPPLCTAAVVPAIRSGTLSLAGYERALELSSRHILAFIDIVASTVPLEGYDPAGIIALANRVAEGTPLPAVLDAQRLQAERLQHGQGKGRRSDREGETVSRSVEVLKRRQSRGMEALAHATIAKRRFLRQEIMGTGDGMRNGEDGRGGGEVVRKRAGWQVFKGWLRRMAGEGSVKEKRRKNADTRDRVVEDEEKRARGKARQTGKAARAASTGREDAVVEKERCKIENLIAEKEMTKKKAVGKTQRTRSEPQSQPNNPGSRRKKRSNKRKAPARRKGIGAWLDSAEGTYSTRCPRARKEWLGKWESRIGRFHEFPAPRKEACSAYACRCDEPILNAIRERYGVNRLGRSLSVAASRAGGRAEGNERLEGADRGYDKVAMPVPSARGPSAPGGVSMCLQKTALDDSESGSEVDDNRKHD